MIDVEQWAEVRRLRRSEGYSVRAIARQLSLDRGTVQKFLEQENYTSQRKSVKRGSLLDPFKAFIRLYVEDCSELSSVQILERLRNDHGYAGCQTLVRDYLRELRKRKFEAYLTLTHIPGACTQIDWAHFGKICIDNTQRRVSAFFAVLAYSRLIYAELTLSERMDAFLEAHVRAFESFGGVTERALYDNCKTAVVRRVERRYWVNPQLINFADHYGFKPRACLPRRPWQKGGVESGIGFMRKNFQKGRAPLETLEDFERERTALRLWVDQVNQRENRTTRRIRLELFEESERETLRLLPQRTYDTAHVEPSVSANKFYRVHFDGNRYSVPHRFAYKKGLLLKATQSTVKIFSDAEPIAEHVRHFGRGRDVRNSEHDRGLIEKKRCARNRVVLGELIERLGPEAEQYTIGLATHQVHVSTQVRKILALADRYSNEDVRVAMLHALSHGAYGVEYVENIIHQNRRTALKGAISADTYVADADLAEITVPEPDLNLFQALIQ